MDFGQAPVEGVVSAATNEDSCFLVIFRGHGQHRQDLELHRKPVLNRARKIASIPQTFAAIQLFRITRFARLRSTPPCVDVRLVRPIGAGSTLPHQG